MRAKVWLQSRSVLSSFRILLMSCKVNFHVVRLQYSTCGIRMLLQNLICLRVILADRVFIDHTFFGVFACDPLQSFVVSVCIFCSYPLTSY